MKRQKEEERVCCGLLEKWYVFCHCLQKPRDPQTPRDTVIFHCWFVVEPQFLYLVVGIKMTALTACFWCTWEVCETTEYACVSVRMWRAAGSFGFVHLEAFLFHKSKAPSLAFSTYFQITCLYICLFVFLKTLRLQRLHSLYKRGWSEKVIVSREVGNAS